MSRLRALQIQWNELVPEGQARGLRGVRPVALYPEGLHERIGHRQNRINWLRRELGMTTAFTAAVLAGVVSDFTFGVELEFVHRGHTRSSVVRALTDAGVQTKDERYNHRVASYWKLTDDGSLRDYVSSSELVSPVLSGDEGFTMLTKACEVLTSLGCKVNKRCGMHVHLGARNEPVEFFKNLTRLYQQAEPLVDSFLAPSRRGPYAGNGFCNSGRINTAAMDRATTLEEVATAYGQDHGAYNARSSRRYRKLNLQSWWQHGTVEFRHHQGTVDAEKACNWVRFCVRMALAARKGATLTGNTLETLLAMLDANETETRYFVNRAAFFARATSVRVA